MGPQDRTGGEISSNPLVARLIAIAAAISLPLSAYIAIWVRPGRGLRGVQD